MPYHFATWYRLHQRRAWTRNYVEKPRCTWNRYTILLHSNNWVTRSWRIADIVPEGLLCSSGVRRYETKESSYMHFEQLWIWITPYGSTDVTSRDSSVSVATRLRTGRLGFYGSIPGGGWEFFSSPLRPERLWRPPSLLSSGYQRLFPWG
jgi:hypothetical protein